MVMMAFLPAAGGGAHTLLVARDAAFGARVCRASPRGPARSAVRMDAAAGSGDPGLPWDTTIAEDGTPLLFMRFLQHQASIVSSLPGSQREPVAAEFGYQSTAGKRAARIGSVCHSSSRFRKIRATYIDAGAAAQVFNSVWYPRHGLDAPILGIDFLAFGPKKTLCVLDFQPLRREPDYLARYCARMEPVRNRYDGLRGKMSAKFYDEAQFFSPQLVFARYGDDGRERVDDELFPAFVEYVDEYVKMVGSECTPDDSDANVARVRELQREYDQYSAERDPAVGLFSSYWGKEWAENFTYNFLFSEAVVPVADAAAPSGAPPA